MDLETADVPDLIEALAERLSSYDIPARQALVIATEMLADAYAAFDDIEPADLDTVH